MGVAYFAAQIRDAMESVSEVRIRGMVCERCVVVIKQGLKELGMPVQRVSLGKIFFSTGELTRDDQFRLSDFLSRNGFEIVSDRQNKVILQVKKVIAEVFSETSQPDTRLKFSQLLAETLHMNYDSISELFSESEGITLERYIITKRIEKVKELLVYSGFSLSEIADLTGYSSIHHLSRQFKEFTGLAPSYFRRIKEDKQRITAR